MAALVIGSTSVVFAADKVDDTVKSTLVTTAEGLTDAIVQLKDEDIENYMSSGDDFTTSAMQSWQTSKDELGAKKDSNGETTVTFKDDQYTVTVPLKFEKADADAAELNEKAAQYRELQNGVASAAARGYVDTVISPADTRKYVIGAFEMLFTKREDRPSKKHGTV